jgi:hypothetical protein
MDVLDTQERLDYSKSLDLGEDLTSLFSELAKGSELVDWDVEDDCGLPKVKY